jgi:hypothetical protein
VATAAAAAATKSVKEKQQFIAGGSLQTFGQDVAGIMDESPSILYASIF